jgi:hypothetical protein
MTAKQKKSQTVVIGGGSSSTSCAFDSERMTRYETLNIKFQDDMKKPAAESIPLLRDLLFMDIAYLHLWSVKWAPKTAVHLGGEQRSDDDNQPAASASGCLDRIRPRLSNRMPILLIS